MNKGYKHSIESRNKMSLARTGYKWDEAAKAKMSASAVGKHEGKSNGHWKGGVTFYRGYKMLADGKKYKYEHRAVAENLLGRPLTANEVVHHWDEDKLNNVPSNLCVMTRADHMWIHKIARQIGCRVLTLKNFWRPLIPLTLG